MKKIASESDLDQLRRASTALAVVSAWSQNGLFKQLADGKAHTLSSLPGNQHALERTVSVLIHLGIVARDGDQIALTHQAQALQATGALAAAPAGYLTDLDQLGRIVREGGPLRATEGGVVESDREGSRRFMDMLHRRSTVSAQEVARWVSPSLKKGAHVLDLGGGHGRYAATLAEQGFRATLFDVPIMVELAQERYANALTYRSGNFMKDDLGGPYDCAFLSNIVHGLSPDETGALFRRLHAVLTPGGLLVVKDMFLTEGGGDPAEAAFFDITMLMFTRGRSYTVAQMNTMYQEAGFAAPRQTYVSDCEFSLLIAPKR
jgi:SAM-dependent methyltransferase